MTKKETIINWLRLRHLLNKFYLNCKTCHGDRVRIEAYFSYGMINSAFCWSDTPEGHGFWSDMNDRFNAWYKSKWH